MTPESRPSEWHHAAWVFLPLLLGITAFAAVVGFPALDPSNIGWLIQDDPKQYYIGWLFYRDAPWQLPVGANPEYGLELSSATIYADANPLMAASFKLISPLLPDTFQYFGLWLLACFLLQGWFAWKLGGLIGRGRVVQACFTVLCLFAPPMLLRTMAHFNLASHFLILAALYLALSPRRKQPIVPWTILLALSTWIHAYLFFMCAAIWAGSLLDRLRCKELRLTQAVLEGGVVLVVTALFVWQAGYFLVSDPSAQGGFGVYRMNMLSIFDPSGWTLLGFDLPQGEGDYEGFNYLGLGGLLLCAAAIPAFARTYRESAVHLARHLFLGLALFALCLFSLTHHLGLGAQSYNFELPGNVVAALNTFRASGRMFWPVFYMLLLGAMALVARAYPARIAMAIAALAALLQVTDLSAVYPGIRKSYAASAESQWDTSLQHPFWDVAAKRYEKLRWLMPKSPSPHWKVVGAYAAGHGMATDVVYLNRFSTVRLKALQEQAFKTITSGTYASDTLYFVDDGAFEIARRKLRRDDWAGRVDGFNVIAPGWRDCNSCAAVAMPSNDAVARNNGVPVAASNRVTPGTGGLTLVSGWSGVEPWGVWTQGKEAVFDVLVPKGARRIRLHANALVNGNLRIQRLQVRVGGGEPQSFELRSADANIVEIRLPDSFNGGRANVHLMLPDATTPAAAGINEDTRILGLGLKSIDFQ